MQLLVLNSNRECENRVTLHYTSCSIAGIIYHHYVGILDVINWIRKPSGSLVELAGRSGEDEGGEHDEYSTVLLSLH